MGSKLSRDKRQELMETSLRNVRALVEQEEAEEAARKRTQKRAIAAIVAVSLILVGIIAVVVSKKPSGAPMVISPPAQSK
jgi:hypothetical protein